MKAEIHAPDMLRRLTMTVHVSGMAEYRVRLWLGMLIMRLGIRILGCRVIVADNDGFSPVDRDKPIKVEFV